MTAIMNKNSVLPLAGHAAPATTSPQMTRTIEQRIAEALKRRGTFEGELTSFDLEPILKNVLFALVSEQRVAGIAAPISHSVPLMKVHMRSAVASVFSELHIHAPIRAIIQFRYGLENDPRAPGKLRLKGGDIEVSEDTHRFDLAAKAALKVLNVHAISKRELSDPNDVIRRTLPPQLRQQGFDVNLAAVELAFTTTDTLRVKLVVAKD
jgi:hypothetical protein